MKRKKIELFALGLLLIFGVLISIARGSDTGSWRAEWDNPSAQNRPLQIIHGRPLDAEQCAYYRDTCGLGGVVVSCPAENGYVQNEENWQKTAQNIAAAQEAGLRVWFYDELAWPSLSAGGAVLARDPSLESLELAYDAEAEEPFEVRPSYEYTFASMDTLRQALRHPNPLDPRACETFLDTTHRKLRDTIGNNRYHQIEAFFTDEPTLLGCSLLPIMTPEAREKYKVADPLDWSKKILPAVPWREGLDEEYAVRYGEPLNKTSLFKGDSDSDKEVRRRFWSMIGDVNADSYFGTIRRFCESDPEGPVASGHTLSEENLLMAVPLDGNKLEVLKQFQLPGQDLLTSEPAEQLQYYWQTNALPVSAAYFIGQRRVMTEISDHIQRHSDKRMVTLDEMTATAGVMASWGITEFTLYYTVNGGADAPYRTEATHRAYTDFVGRMNAVLREAEPVRPLLLYYPIETIQEEYLPMGETLNIEKYTSKAMDTFLSYTRTGKNLSCAQMPFLLADAQTLKELAANESGKNDSNTKSRTIRKLSDFSALVVSKNAQIPDTTLPIIRVDTDEVPLEPCRVAEAVKEFAGPRLKLLPDSEQVALGAFVRDGALIFVLVNTAAEEWTGNLRLDMPEQCAFGGNHFTYSEKGNLPFGTGSAVSRLNPANGEWVDLEKFNEDREIPLTLTPNETVILVIEQNE